MVYLVSTTTNVTNTNNVRIVEELCKQLGICYRLDTIKEYTCTVLDSVYKVHGQKRRGVKMALILYCINKVVNASTLIEDMAKRVNIDKKYIYKAEKLLAELPRQIFCLDTPSPVEYVKSIYNTHDNSIIEYDIMQELEQFVNICQKNHVLARNTYTCMGSSCLYFILLNHGYHVEIDTFCKTYNISKTNLERLYKTLEDFVKTFLSRNTIII